MIASMPKRRSALRLRLKKTWMLYAMLVLPFIAVLIFRYVPLYGLIIAFQDYNPAKGFMGSEWVGMKWFKVAMALPDFGEILSNTLTISMGKIIIGQGAAVLFALLLNEMRSKALKRTVQTITYFPHFLSWVIVGGVFTDMLSFNGIINQLVKLLGGTPLFFLGSNDLFQPVMIALDVWKGFGYGAIVYLAAITGINDELYEAASLDGAGRIRQTIHVTLPGISVTIVMMAILNIGNILNAGFDQIFVMYNASVYETGDILDTFIYRQGLLNSQYSMSTAIGMFKSLIGATLMILANAFASRRLNYRIF